MQTVKASALNKLSKEDVENYHDYQNRVQRCIGQRSTSVCKQINHTNPPLRLIPKTIHTDTSDMPLSTSIHSKSIQQTKTQSTHPNELSKCHHHISKQEDSRHDDSTRRSSVMESKEAHTKHTHKPHMLLANKENLSLFLKILSEHVIHCSELEKTLRDNFLIS